MSNHVCPVNGCTESVRRDRLMCRRHWYMVPPKLREALWAEFDAAPGGPGHVSAMRSAIASVNARIAQ